MKFDRNLIESVMKENNFKTIEELLIYIDYQDYFELINQKSKELENGILKFRYDDRTEALNSYKKELYKEMINKGRKLNKEKCGISF